jgi:hypothetical protein
MADVQKGRWREVCAQATEEQDPEKLRMLITEFTRLLDMEEKDDHKTALQNYKRST